MSKLNDIMKLCVGGKEFKTTRATLIADQNSMLAKMFEEYDESTLIPAASKGDIQWLRGHNFSLFYHLPTFTTAPW